MDFLAEIERMQLEIEYDQLKHQLSPRHKKNSVSPGTIRHQIDIFSFFLLRTILERSTFQYDFPPPPTAPHTNKPPPAPPLPQSLKQNEHQHEVSSKVNEGKSILQIICHHSETFF